MDLNFFIFYLLYCCEFPQCQAHFSLDVEIDTTLCQVLFSISLMSYSNLMFVRFLSLLHGTYIVFDVLHLTLCPSILDVGFRPAHLLVLMRLIFAFSDLAGCV